MLLTLGLVETEKLEKNSPPSLPERSALVKGTSSLNASGSSHVSAAYGLANRQQKVVVSSRPIDTEEEFMLETSGQDIEDNEEEEEQEHVIETEVETDERYMPIRHGEYHGSEFDEMDDQFEATENWNSQVK